MDSADPKKLEILEANIASFNPGAKVIRANLAISVEDPAKILGKRVLVVEDGPTLTHGEMTYGAGTIAAEDFGAAEIVDPRPFAVGSILAIYAKYKHVKNLLPAMGYSREQIQELEETIRRIDCDTVVAGTPVDLRRVIKVDKPIVRVRYELDEIGHPSLAELITERLGPRLQGRTG